MVKERLKFNKLWLTFLFVFILLLGFALRVYQIDKESIWLDESFTIDNIDKENVSSVISQSFINELQPPSYFILLYNWVNIFGLSVFSIRFFSLLFGVISILLVYLLAKTIFNKEVGLLSAFFLSISVFGIMFSQEARSYSFFVALSILSILLFSKLVKKEEYHKKSDKVYILIFFVNAFINSVHYFGWLLFIVENIIFIYLFFNKKKILKKWLLYQSLIIVSFLPFLPDFIRKLMWFSNYLTGIFSSKLGLPNYISHLGVIIFILPVLLSILVLCWVVQNKRLIFRKYDRFKKESLVIGILAFYLIILLFIKLIYSPSFITRYTLLILPFLYIIFAKIITDCKNNKLKITSLILILIFSAASILIYYNDTTKEDWKTASSIISTYSVGKEVIFFDSGDVIVPFNYYYLDYNKGNLNEIKLDHSTERLLKNNTNNFWLVLSHNQETIGYYDELIPDDFNLKFKKDYKGIAVYYYIKGEQ